MGNVHFKGHRARLHREHLRRQRLPCWLCGQPISYDAEPDHPLAFTVDHETAQHLAPELAYDRRNLRPAHRKCNSSKGTGNGAHLKPAPRSREW